MKTLMGKVAFITGAAKGNGAGIAKVMSEKGAQVILADIDPLVFETARAISPDAVAYQMDVSDWDGVAKVADQVIQRFGKLDILVNNAGIARLIPVEKMDDELRDFHYRVNVVGVWNCTKAFITHMMRARYGRIINMSSVTGPRVTDPGMMGYATSKAAVLGFTKAIAIDVASYGITANAILPGYILTPMVEHTAHETNPENPQAVIDGIAAGIPLGRLGTPEEIGYLAAFLASDEAAYITGSELLIDGGSTLPETSTVGRR
jgi:hypothetical protein